VALTARLHAELNRQRFRQLRAWAEGTHPRPDPEEVRLRPYQLEADAAVETALAERKRNLLVAMATSAGKTFTIVNQIYRLMKAGLARRVVFLVDRRALAAQAVRAFVYVATIQRMAVNILGRQAVFGIGGRGRDRGRRRPPRHPDPRLRPRRRGRVPPRLHLAGAVRLARLGRRGPGAASPPSRRARSSPGGPRPRSRRAGPTLRASPPRPPSGRCPALPVPQRSGRSAPR
jgi:hypothetical protein